MGDYDLQNARPTDSEADRIREAIEVCSTDEARAEAIGNARGYRAIIERFNAGELTRAQL